VRTVTIGGSKVVEKIRLLYPSNYHVNVNYSENFFEKNLITVRDLYKIQHADVCFIYGTWGSKNRNRVWHPVNNVRRQAWLENINTFFTSLFKLYNKKFIVLETGTLCRIRNAFVGAEGMLWKKTRPIYYRMALNHWTYGKAKFCKPTSDRLSQYYKNNPAFDMNEQLNSHTWKNNLNGDIIICPGLENDPTATKPVEQFVLDTYNELKKYTDKNIIIKPHPGSKIDYLEVIGGDVEIIEKTKAYKDIADNLYCAVLDNSTSIFELTFLGIPCFTSSANFGYKLGNNDLSKVNNIHYNTSEQMKEWYNEMAYTEFSEHEFRTGNVKNSIEELVNE